MGRYGGGLMGEGREGPRVPRDGGWCPAGSEDLGLK